MTKGFPFLEVFVLSPTAHRTSNQPNKCMPMGLNLNFIQPNTVHQRKMLPTARRRYPGSSRHRRIVVQLLLPNFSLALGISYTFCPYSIFTKLSFIAWMTSVPQYLPTSRIVILARSIPYWKAFFHSCSKKTRAMGPRHQPITRAMSSPIFWKNVSRLSFPSAIRMLKYDLD